MKKNNLTQDGFTLIELLVVVSIIGLLSSIVVSSLSLARSKAQDALRIENIKSLKTALELYYNDNGGYPTSNSSINGDVPLSDTVLVGKLSPNYITSIPSILVSDGDHYYANGVTSGVSSSYSLYIYTKNNGVCLYSTRPGSNDWGLTVNCNF